MSMEKIRAQLRRAKGAMTVVEISDAIGVDAGIVNRQLQVLFENGEVTRLGAGAGERWAPSGRLGEGTATTAAPSPGATIAANSSVGEPAQKRKYTRRAKEVEPAKDADAPAKPKRKYTRRAKTEKPARGKAKKTAKRKCAVKRKLKRVTGKLRARRAMAAPAADSKIQFVTLSATTVRRLLAHAMSGDTPLDAATRAAVIDATKEVA